MGKKVEKIQVKCVVCNNVEFVNPCRAKSYKTCSIDCRTKLSIKNLSTKVTINCVVCNKEFAIKLSHKQRRKCCSKKCLNKLYETKYLGVKNPNCKYKTLNHDFFKTVDTEFKAYLLGWISSDGSLTEGSVKITIRDYDYAILNTLRNNICEFLEIKNVKSNMISLTISSKSWVKDICKLLNIKPGKKSHTVDFPQLENELLTWAFIRGVFDGDGTLTDINTKSRTLKCGITSSSSKMLTGIYNFCNLPGSICKSGFVTYSGKSALIFLNKIYDNANYYLRRKYNQYCDWSTWKNGLLGHYKKFENYTLIKTDKSAKYGYIENDQHVLYLNYRHSTYINNVVLYGTNLKINVTNNNYAYDIVENENLINAGYKIYEKPQLLDRIYKNEILIPVVKIDQNKPDIDLSLPLVKMVKQHILQAVFTRVEKF